MSELFYYFGNGVKPAWKHGAISFNEIHHGTQDEAVQSVFQRSLAELLHGGGGGENILLGAGWKDYPSIADIGGSLTAPFYSTTRDKLRAPHFCDWFDDVSASDWNRGV